MTTIPVKKKKASKKRKHSSSPDPRKKQDIDTTPSKEVAVVVPEGTTTTGLGTPDITKKDLVVRQPMELDVTDIGDKGTLTSLVMKSGSVDDILTGENNTWPALAGKLKKIFLPYQQSLSPKEQKDYVAQLGTVYYETGKKPAVKVDPDNARFLVKGEVDDTVAFLEKFMRANGQWDYIEKQDWFKDGKFIIGIDVNYYPDRSGYNTSPMFHKDTGGNNIFVNLVFDNEKPIEATEWFADLAQPSKKRISWQKDLLPSSHLEELDKSRTALQKTFGTDEPVHGGVSSGPHSYVSWVDDLVWHATPTDQPRIEYSAKIAKAAHTLLDKASKGEDFSYDSPRLQRTILGVEILGTMAEHPGTTINKWLTEKGLSAQDVDVDVAKEAWQELYSGPTGKAQFGKDAEIRGELPWRITGQYSEATAEDDRLAKTTSLQETPRGLSTRRRANSLNPKAIAEVRAANKDIPRSFLRTWIRILPKSSKEALGSGLAK